MARRDAARRRRQSRWLGVLGLLALAAAAVAGLLAGGVIDSDLFGGWSDRLRPGSTSVPDPGAEDPTPGAQAASALLVGTDDQGAARWLAVLAAPAPGDAATVLLVPVSLLADVPGVGTAPLAEALPLGGAPLVAASLADLLGVRLDTTVEVTTSGWGEVAATAGGIDVTLRAGVQDPGRGVGLEPGAHRLDTAATVAVLEAAGPPLGELETLARVAPVLSGVVRAISADPDLAERITAPADGPAPLASPDPEAVAAVLVALADARSRDELAVLTLPVVPVGDGAGIGFEVDPQRAEPLLGERFGPWQAEVSDTVGRDVQILNGNGVPRISDQVTQLLAGGGYRVVLTGNADRFTHETTRIILHDDTPEQVAVGRDLQGRLGVGELELAATPSSAVDVTIVVGQDFPPADGA